MLENCDVKLGDGLIVDEVGVDCDIVRASTVSVRISNSVVQKSPLVETILREQLGKEPLCVAVVSHLLRRWIVCNAIECGVDFVRQSKLQSNDRQRNERCISSCDDSSVQCDAEWRRLDNDLQIGSSHSLRRRIGAIRRECNDDDDDDDERNHE